MYLNILLYSPILDRSVYIFTQMCCFYYMFDRHVRYLCTYIAVYLVFVLHSIRANNAQKCNQQQNQVLFQLYINATHLK
jgi:hypothetical protein